MTDPGPDDTTSTKSFTEHSKAYQHGTEVVMMIMMMMVKLLQQPQQPTYTFTLCTFLPLLDCYARILVWALD